jgi:IclR family transcriptional regulator, pca regulon regulatory protein
MSGPRPHGKPKRKADAIDPRYMVPGLSRGLRALALFTRSMPTLSLVELARGLKLSRSAAYRLIYTLDKDGFVLRDEETRKYRLTSKTLSLGLEYLHSQTITEIAQPYLRNLSNRTAAAAYVAILDGWHAVYLARAVPPVGLVSGLQTGTRLPAHLTASGRIMLAFAEEAPLTDMFQRLKREGREVQCPAWQDLSAQARADRQRGYVFHRSIIDPGLVSLACPIRDHDSTTVAAVTVIVPEKVCDGFGGEKALRPLVADTAAEISGRLGYRG